MRLLMTTFSPYARKCWAAIIELGIEDRVELIRLPPRLPNDAKPDVEVVNPLSKVPALMTPAGPILDSRVIAAYLNEFAGGTLYGDGSDRWGDLTLEALADGICDAGVVVRLEQVRARDTQRAEDVYAHQRKIHAALDFLEANPPSCDRFHIGKIALVSAIDWLRFRNVVPDPLLDRPALSSFHACWSPRPCLAETLPG